jgi:DNA polymerase IV
VQCNNCEWAKKRIANCYVEANRVRKSIGAETSFAQDLSDVGQMLQELEQIAQIVEQRLE